MWIFHVSLSSNGSSRWTNITLAAEAEMARHISVISRCRAAEKAERHDSIFSLDLEIMLGEGWITKRN
jgi:hypothetical protein